MVQLISNQPIGSNDQIANVTTYQGSTSLRIHAMGFLEIASVAARAALENKTAIDAITPSIIYAIRHAAELYLKAIIAEVKETHPETEGGANKKKGKAETGHHGLQRLWSEHQALIVEVLDYEAAHDEHTHFDRQAWLADFSAIIDQLYAVDPDGQSLRYPANQKGVPNLGGTMPVSVGQLERFARHATAVFSSFDQRTC